MRTARSGYSAMIDMRRTRSSSSGYAVRSSAMNSSLIL